ncbi:MAG: hypothetical protein RR478_04745 [Bacilli bacterium]
MKKTKNVIISLIFTIAFFIGINGIKATTYASYKVGDLITINVNDTEKVEFYVIAESNDTSKEVTAITKSLLGTPILFGPTTKGLAGSEAEKALNQVTSTWANLLEKRLINANEIKTDLAADASLYGGYNFTTPGWARVSEVDKSYFTQTVISGQSETYSVFAVKGFASLSNLASIYSSSATPAANAVTGYIRPVITISKDHVQGGAFISESETAWKSFVADFKTGSILKNYEIKNPTFKITVADTPTTLKVTVNTGKADLITNFKYTDGVLEYVASNDVNMSIFDALWISQAIQSLSNLKKYDYKELSAWIGKQDQKALTIKADGIFFTTVPYEIKDDKGIVTLTGDRYTKFGIDLVNGIKTFKPTVKPDTKPDITVDTETTVENPKTGLKYGIGVISIIVVGAAGYAVYYKTKKSNKFPKVK